MNALFSQSVENYVLSFFKFHSNLLKVFRVDLKACLGLVLPASLSAGIRKAGFWVIVSWATPIPLWFLLYSTIILYDIDMGPYVSLAVLRYSDV